MFCPNCGTQITHNASFCPNCGTAMPVTYRYAGSGTVQQKNKNSKLKWVLPVIAVGTIIVTILSIILFVYLFGLIKAERTKNQAIFTALDYVGDTYCAAFEDDITSIEKIEDERFVITCNIEQDYDFWDSTGTVTMVVFKDDEEWMVEVEEENIDFIFEPDHEWYYIFAEGNEKYIVKMIDFSEDEVTLEYYAHDLPNYYDHDITSCKLKYDSENRCLAFEFRGEWRIYGYSIGYNRYEVGAFYEFYQTGDFEILKPINPYDVWWYEEAQKE